MLSSTEKGLVQLSKKAVCRKKHSTLLLSHAFAADTLHTRKSKESSRFQYGNAFRMLCSRCTTTAIC